MHYLSLRFFDKIFSISFRKTCKLPSEFLWILLLISAFDEYIRDYA